MVASDRSVEGSLDLNSIGIAKYRTTEPAPWYAIPSAHIIGVEHPCIIRNRDKAVQSLGGLDELHGLLLDQGGQPLHLNLNPGNRESTLIKSAKAQTKNVVLKITVPQRTGRKRRRGSNGSFWEPDSSTATPANGSIPALTESSHVQVANTAKRFLRSLQDNEGKYKPEAVGLVEETHRFRSLPDYAFATTNSPFMDQMRDRILPFDYVKMKDFELDLSKGVKSDTDIIPPPHLSAVEIPFNYAYVSNPSAAAARQPNGKTIIRNISLPIKQLNQHTPLTAIDVPMGPSDLLPAFETLEPAFRRLITSARELLRKRPIYTRRALFNSLPREDLKTIGQNATKYITQYVGYMFEGGPWGNAIMRFGVDPRKDPSYRIYQTMMFMLDTEPWRKGAANDGGRVKRSKRYTGEIAPNMGEQPESHIFHGTKYYGDGKIWQICDVTDPILVKVLATDELRERCDTRYDGWFHNATMAKAKIIMRQKLLKLRKGEPVDDSKFDKVVALPEVYNASTADNFKISKWKKDELGKDEAAWIETVRSTSSRSQLREKIGMTGASGRAGDGVEAVDLVETEFDAGDFRDQEEDAMLIGGEPEDGVVEHLLGQRVDLTLGQASLHPEAGTGGAQPDQSEPEDEVEMH